MADSVEGSRIGVRNSNADDFPRHQREPQTLGEYALVGLILAELLASATYLVARMVGSKSTLEFPGYFCAAFGALVLTVAGIMAIISSVAGRRVHSFRLGAVALVTALIGWLVTGLVEPTFID